MKPSLGVIYAAVGIASSVDVLGFVTGGERVEKALHRASCCVSQCPSRKIIDPFDDEALEKIADMGKILSEVILYDPGSFSTPGKPDSESA